MNKQSYANNVLAMQMSRFRLGSQRKLFIGLILFVALIAFELFNFDTTRFALSDLLGDVKFVGIQWAAILAVAFCAIDFAGLFKLFTPDRGGDDRGVWYLMGAWLIGATMNAMMTWWAVSLTLLDHSLGNEVLSREQLLRYVPIFVAVLVWLTRILFIGAFSVAGDQLFDKRRPSATASRSGTAQSIPASAGRTSTPPARLKAEPAARPQTQSMPTAKPAQPAPPPPAIPPAPVQNPSYSQEQRPSRVRQRPPVPNSSVRRPPNGLQARGRN